ncbi:MAG: tRNA pseudouridine(55) synthase TruB, partial [Burkholderiales bacterium]
VAVVKHFSGTLLQVPPMYSAIKVSGKPLYSYARSGVEIERAPRTIVIYELKLEIIADQMMKMWVTCSKGTYVRVLAQDIAKYFGTGGYLTELRRTRVGDIAETETLKLDHLDSLSSIELPRVLRPLDSCLGGLAKIKVCNEFKNRLINGLAVNVEGDSQVNCKVWPAHVRLYDGADFFFGVGELQKTGELRAKRLLSTTFYGGRASDNSLY